MLALRMSDDETKARDEHLMSALCVALTAGHAVSAPQPRVMYILPNVEKRQYVVWVEGNGQVISEDTFDDVRAAVAFYLDLCEQP